MNRSREPVSPTSFASRTPRLTLGISASSKNTVLIFLCFQGWVACKDEDAGHRRAMMINRVRYLLFRICSFLFSWFSSFSSFFSFLFLLLLLSLSLSLSRASCVRFFAEQKGEGPKPNLTAAFIPESVTWKIVCTVPIVVLLSLHTSTLKLALPKISHAPAKPVWTQGKRQIWLIIKYGNWHDHTFRVRSTLYLLDSRPCWDILGALAS